MTGPVLVTGATGNTGRPVTAGLRAAGVPVRTATRGQIRAESGGEHVHFDWADPATYRPALSGVERVYLVAPIGMPNPAKPIDHFLSAARAAGVRRVVFLSSDVIPPGAPGLDHARRAVCRMAEWAVLRPSWFMQNFIVPTHPMAAGLRTRSELISATGGRGIGFVDAADIAAVGVRALLDDAAPNREYVITGPEALSYDDIARLLNRSLAPPRPVRHIDSTPGELAEHLTAHGVPPEMATVLAGAERLIAAGAEDRVTTTVARVTGRMPRSFGEFIAIHRDRIALPGPRDR
ncbi:NAD(P)H-binding protein [Nocardia arthritidis]|uniref:NAD(P)H-binding protein n=1 Tax=Nocardia arthritidis TaxID=228602 RepID=A0A6G9YTQ1_9NOCA|nr:NAD(P)H-binding protein [Nocardia arthritidis]QIS16263.1 NAD(P)H-binding protein [Nocardia arthritidis]